MRTWATTLLMLCAAATYSSCDAFQQTTRLRPATRHCVPPASPTCLFGKGFQGAKNKQAALAQKMKQAKKQKAGEEEGKEKAEEDEAHAEFARLLAANPPKKPPKESSPKAASALFNLQPKKPKNSNPVGAKNKKNKSSKKEQSEEDIPAILQVGDKARRFEFEALVNPATGQPIGPVQAAQLVPWVPPFLTDYLVVVADPRRQSNDFRLTVQYLHSTASLGKMDKKTTFLAVSANDAPKEVLAWKERVHIMDDKFPVFIDSASLDWMTTYACVDDWSLNILVLDSDGIIRYRQGGVDPSTACTLVDNTIASLRADT